MPHSDRHRSSMGNRAQDVAVPGSRATRLQVEGPVRATAVGSSSDRAHAARAVPLVVVSPHQYEHAYFRADDPANYLG